MKNNILFAVIIMVIIAVLYLVSGSKSPQIPLDDIHSAAVTEQDCLNCHGEGKAFVWKPGHPPKDQCFLCHKRARKKKAK
jgi:hypothetical protein